MIENEDELITIAKEGYYIMIYLHNPNQDNRHNSTAAENRVSKETGRNTLL